MDRAGTPESSDTVLPDGYELVRRLGTGTTATVYLARNTALQRLVAIKVLSPELAEDEVARQRFVREARAASRIAYPSVVTIYSVGELSSGLPFIEMEYVDGSTLADVLQRNGAFDPLSAQRILEKIASGLAAAHDQHIIHRDLKPANVLVAHDSGDVYLADFGLAGIIETGSTAATKLTQDGERLGDPRYISPEHLRGEPLTEQSDIYSLGIIGYEMLSLEGPYGQVSSRDIAAAHLRTPPRNLSDLVEGVPRILGDLLMRCVSKNPEHRPRARDIVATLDADTDHQPVPEHRNALVRFMLELRERRVYRAVATYAAAVFVILQVADLVFPPIGVPDIVYQFLVIGSLGAFPIVTILAWVFDLREGRLIRTSEPSKRTSSRARVLLQVIGVLLSILLAAAGAYWFLG
ncbi:MAG: serine/threonine-protein kinase [Woeseiaceae bacterium]|nr:serine/threonine-protein kinase [Woeseiaceae bacterium]